MMNNVIIVDAFTRGIWEVAIWGKQNLGYIPEIKQLPKATEYKVTFRSESDAVGFKLTYHS
jgi:hypothetical protein